MPDGNTTEVLSPEELTPLNDNGLTDKQNRAIPYLAVSPTLSSGVDQIVKLRIISTRDYFYRKWRHEPYFMKVLVRERDTIRGELYDRLRNLVYSAGEDTMIELMKIAFCDDKSRFAAQKTKALNTLLAIMGFDVFGGAKVDVTVNNQIQTKQAAFKQLVENGVRKRNGTLGVGTVGVPNGREVPSDN